MKKVFLCLMLLCGIAMISTSCKKENEQVKPETETGSMVVGSKTVNIVNADAVKYGQKNAIVLTSKTATENDNEGVAIVFAGEITPGTYKMDGSKDQKPRVVGLKAFSMGEIQFVIEADDDFYGDAYLWIDGELSVTEDNGTYSVILSQCTATNDANANGRQYSLFHLIFLLL